VHALASQAGAASGRGSLPEYRAGEEERLPGAAEAHPDKLREEDAQTLVQTGP
jgi:hypothetical protein